MKFTAHALVLSAALAAAFPAFSAVEVKGVKFGDTHQVANQNLVLNGAGVRVKVIVNVYAAGLYVAKKDNNAAGVINQPGAKSMQMTLLRDLTGEDFAEAMIAGFKKNASAAEMSKYQSRLDELLALMKSLGSVSKGTSIHMNLIPGSGTRVLIAGSQKGKDIQGDDFYNALLKIWLGNSPVDSDLKEELLGG